MEENYRGIYSLAILPLVVLGEFALRFGFIEERKFNYSGERVDHIRDNTPVSPKGIYQRSRAFIYPRNRESEKI